MSKKSFKIDNSLVLRPQTSAPTSPENGEMYFDSILGTFRKYENSQWVDIGSGSGGGGINYAVNQDFETDVTTGVTDGTYFTSAAETTNNIRGTQSLAITMSSSFTGTDFQTLALDNIDPADKGKALTLAFEYATDSNYTSDDVEVRIYDNTNAAYINVNATEDFDGKLKATSGETDSRKFIGQWYAASDSVDYDVHIFGLVAPGSNSKIIVDNVRVGPESFYNMPIVSDWIAYTPTAGATNMTASGQYRRVGDVMEVKVGAYATGTPTGSLTISIPSGFTIDTTKFPVGTGGYKVGIVYIENSAIAGHDGYAYIASSTTIGFVVQLTSGSFGSSSGATVSSPFTWGVDDYLRVIFQVPITEWANSSTTMSTTQANLQTVKAEMTSTTATSVPNSTATKIGWSDVSYDDIGMASTANDRMNIYSSGDYLVECALFFGSATSTQNSAIQLIAKVNGTTDYILSATGYAASDTRYRGVNGSRVLKGLKPGDYVEIYVYQDLGATLTKWVSLAHFGIAKQPDFTTIGVYSPYEVLSAASSAKTPAASDQYANMTGNSLTLTPGTWKLEGFASCTNNGSTPVYIYGQAYIYGANGADSASSPALMTTLSGLSIITDSNVTFNYFPSVASLSLVLQSVIIELTQTQTVYLVPYTAMTTASVARLYTYLNARRLK